jgi:hypothetical protein
MQHARDLAEQIHQELAHLAIDRRGFTQPGVQRRQLIS